MRNRFFRCALVFLILFIVSQFHPVYGQYREYYFYGKVIDPQKEPLADVEILLRDIDTSRSYSVKTNEKGEFKLAGLPHGIYKVSFKKEGYVLKEDEWRFTTRHNKMQKVEIPPVTLVSESQFNEAMRMKEMEGAVKEAQDKIRERDYDGAITMLKDVLDKDPEDPNALYPIGMSYSKKQMYTEGIEALTQVVQLVPNFPPAHFELAICYQNQGDQHTALEHYRKTLGLDPNNPDAAYNTGLILFQQNRMEEALTFFEKAVSLRPEDPAYLEMAGRCQIHQGNLVKAVEYLEKAKTGYTDTERTKFLEDLITKLKEQIKQ
ncbi:MAG: tetratricopeptide repeat protein [Candidatus Aminicenantes bacterium]|jgi:tetratricopeptide (TPR) repeat protein